jgi:hypothetical protein
MNTWQTRRTRWGQSAEQRLAWLRIALRRPGAKLVLEHSGKHGHQFRIVPANVRVSDEEARTLIRRRLVRVHDPDLFNDQPQSWTCN